MMKQLVSALALVVMALACAGEASALVQRTFVSGVGLDTNPCTRTAPCRTFGVAIEQTLPGGEVIALDSAGYGPVAIDKAISLISPPGVYAGITTTVADTNAISIVAGASDVVVLKGLSISGLGIGSIGVNFFSGAELYVEGLTISGFVYDGIYFGPVTSARATITDSLVRNNGSTGITVYGQAGQTAYASIDGTRIAGNFYGLFGNGTNRVTMRDSVASGNGGTGLWAATATSQFNLENVLSTGNSEGIASWGLIRAAGTTVTDNEFGLSTDLGGSLLSRGHKTVEGNAVNGTFTGAFTAK